MKGVRVGVVVADPGLEWKRSIRVAINPTLRRAPIEPDDKLRSRRWIGTERPDSTTEHYTIAGAPASSGAASEEGRAQIGVEPVEDVEVGPQHAGEDQQDDQQETELAVARHEHRRPGRQEGQQDARAVQGRDGQDVETGQDQVQQHAEVQQRQEYPRGVHLPVGPGVDAEEVGRLERQGEDQRQNDVRSRPDQADVEAVPLGIAQVAHVHGHGLGRPDDETGLADDQQRRQQDRAEKVDVRDRVQRQPTGQAGGVVAAAVGHPGVGRLVEGEAEQQHGDGDDDLEPLHGAKYLSMSSCQFAGQ